MSPWLFRLLWGASLLLFVLVLFQRTFLAQWLGPSLAEPSKYNLGEYTGDLDVWLRPY